MGVASPPGAAASDGRAEELADLIKAQRALSFLSGGLFVSLLLGVGTCSSQSSWFPLVTDPPPPPPPPPPAVCKKWWDICGGGISTSRLGFRSL